MALFTSGLSLEEGSNRSVELFGDSWFSIYYVGKFVGGAASFDSIRSRVGTLRICPGKCHKVANSSTFNTNVTGWKYGFNQIEKGHTPKTVC